MNKVDRQAITELVESRSTTSLGIITYLSAIAISKINKDTGYPTIENHTTYKLYKKMHDKMKYINESSVRLAVERLIEQGFFAYLDEDKTKLVILNSGSGHIKSDRHFKSKGYITLHHFFFTESFFNLSLKAKKLCLIIICRLNNSSVKSVNINFKSLKNSDTFKYYCKILKVNRFAHIKYVINELKSLLHIVKLSNNTVRFSLNHLSKAIITGADKLFTFTQAQLIRTEKLITKNNIRNLNFKPKHVCDICEAICDCNIDLCKKTIKELCKYNRDNVKNFLAYTKSIVTRLQMQTEYV